TRSKRDWSSDVCSSDLQCRTDEHGKVYLSTGAGSLHLFAAGQGRYADEILDTRESRSCTLTLAKRLDCCPETEGWRDLDLIPPRSEERRVGRVDDLRT